MAYIGDEEKEWELVLPERVEVEIPAEAPPAQEPAPVPAREPEPVVSE